MKRKLQFGNELASILAIYKDGSDEPLDGDEIDSLVSILWCQLNLTEGNITEDEYNDYLDNYDLKFKLEKK
jgi:hypothetical protein